MAMFPKAGSDGDKTIVFPRWPVVGIFLIALFYFMADARAFLMPVTLAILLFFVFTPFRRFMERIGIGSTITAAIVTLGMLVGVGALGMAATGPVSDMMDDMPHISAQLKERFADIRATIRPLEEAAEQIDAVASGGDGAAEGEPPAPRPATPGTTGTTVISDGTTTAVTTETAPSAIQPDGTVTAGQQNIRVEVKASTDSGGGAGAAAAQVLALGPAMLGQVIFTLVLLFFMISSGDLLYLKIVQSFDKMSDKRRAYTALREIEDSLGSYLSAITLINAGLGICIGVAMWWWDMPSPLLFGLAGFLLNFIPYIGAIAGTIISVLVALVVFDDLVPPLLVGATYLALTSIEGQLITPYFVSRRLKMNEVVVFLTVAMWAWLWSVIGMVVAVPVLVVLRVLSAHIPGMEKFGNFLAGENPPELDEEDDGEEAETEAGTRPAEAAP